jgi:hypothetical protein
MVQGEIVTFIDNFKQSQAAGAEEIATYLSLTKQSGDQTFTGYCEYLTTLDEAQLIENQMGLKKQIEMRQQQIKALEADIEKYQEAGNIADVILSQKNSDGAMIASETLQYALSKIFYDRTVGRSRFAGGGAIVPMEEVAFTSPPAHTYNIQNLTFNSLNI